MAIAQTDPTQPQDDSTLTKSAQPVTKPTAPAATNPTTQQPAAAPALPVAGSTTPASTPASTPAQNPTLPVATSQVQTLTGIQPTQTSDPLAFTPATGATGGGAAPFTPDQAASAIAGGASPVQPQQNGGANAYDQAWNTYNTTQNQLSQFMNAPAANVPGGADINVKLSQALSTGQITPEQFQALSRQAAINAGQLGGGDTTLDQPGVAAPWAMGQTDLSSGAADPQQEVAKLYVSGAITPEQYQAWEHDPNANPIAGITPNNNTAQEQTPGYYKDSTKNPYMVGQIDPATGKPIQATLQPNSAAAPMPIGDANPATPNASNTLLPQNNTPTPATPGGQTLPGVGAAQGFTNGNPTASPSTPGSSPTSTTSSPSSTPNVSTAPTLTPLTPDNALTNSIINPASNVNRFDVAKQQIQDEIQNELEPQFNADSRTIAANSFGAGRGVSGMNRTAEGNLALQHSRDINQLTSNFLNPALTGTIQDSLNNANFAAGQQQFEAGQQQQAYNQNV